MANDIGILTVARYLQEGVGDGVRCFVDTECGLHEVEGFVGSPGALQGILTGLRRRNCLTFRKTEAVTVNVFLDTEVFLATRDLTGLSRADVITVAERAASFEALTRPAQYRYTASIEPINVAQPLINAPKEIAEAVLPTSMWQG